jgi:aminoglycoside phosphotransferase (APT) family kinase protein
VTASQRDRFEQLVSQIAPQSKLLRTWPLKGGISAEMTAFEIEHPDGQTTKLIVRRPGDEDLKRNPRAAEDEFELLRTLQSTDLATPKPYHLDPSGEIFPTPCLVIEYVEGEMEFCPSDLSAYAHQLATHLAKIHRVDLSVLDLSFLPRQANGCTENLSLRTAEVDGSLDAERIRDALASAWPLPQRNASALLHGDFWPGNLLWQKGRLVAVIDWENAKLGDPLADLANCRLEIAWIFGIEAMQAFTEHYQSVMALDYADLPYWDLCAALRLIHLADPNLAEWATSFAPLGRPDITEQTMREHLQWFIEQAFETLAAEDH